VRWTLDEKRLSRYKIEYIKCDFSITTHEKGMLDSIMRSYQESFLSLIEIDATKG
jgi:hypothetical protein